MTDKMHSSRIVSQGTCNAACYGKMTWNAPFVCKFLMFGDGFVTSANASGTETIPYSGIITGTSASCARGRLGIIQRRGVGYIRAATNSPGRARSSAADNLARQATRLPSGNENGGPSKPVNLLLKVASDHGVGGPKLH